MSNALDFRLGSAFEAVKAHAVGPELALSHAHGIDPTRQPGQVRVAMNLSSADLPVPDCDALFDAVSGRLTSMASGSAEQALRVGLSECVEAMQRLHVSVGHERKRNHQLELDLFDARTALAQARVELVGSRSEERRSRRLALHDDLTLLPNRSFFSEWLEQTLVSSAPLQQSFAVLYLDLDGFKPINDTFGHAVGDELLRIVAARLARAVRAEDVVSRLGGDEFACLLTNFSGREQLGHLACKLFDAVAAPVKIGAHDVTVCPSIGIAMCPTDGNSAAALLHNADAAMYHAKRERSGYAFFDRRSAS